MLTGGVSGSSSVITLVVGSKKWTLAGVDGAIVIAWVVKAIDVNGRESDGSGRRP